MVVCRLDRLGRSLPDLLNLIQDLTDREVGLRSLAEHIDTTSATGRLVQRRTEWREVANLRRDYDRR